MQKTMTRTRQGQQLPRCTTASGLDNNREITRLSGGGGGCGEMLSNKDNSNNATTATMCSSYDKRREMYETKLASPCTCDKKGPFKKPCLAADCLNRSFKEAQNFVNSLGRVPGVAGLGLMDITDRPYYGRHREADPCANMDNRRDNFHSEDQDRNASSITEHEGGGTGSPGKPLRKRPDDYYKQQQQQQQQQQREPGINAAGLVDVQQSGPCGEAKCKSRRRISAAEQPVTDDEPQDSSGEARRHSPHRSRGSRQRQHSVNAKFRVKSRVSLAAAAPPKRPRIMKFVYSACDMYPGMNIGHKTCVQPWTRIPANKGWLWSDVNVAGKPGLKPRPGWKPGAIARYLRELLRDAKSSYWEQRGNNKRPKSEERSSSRKRRGPAESSPRRMKNKTGQMVGGRAAKAGMRKRDPEVDDKEPPPTLYMHRKDGAYYVTMYPIRDERYEVPTLEDPIKPLQFKIAKSKDDATDSSSTASDMELEFSPPAAVNRYRKKPDVIHTETQVRQQQIIDAFKGAKGKKGDARRRKKK